MVGAVLADPEAKVCTCMVCDSKPDEARKKGAGAQSQESRPHGGRREKLVSKNVGQGIQHTVKAN